MRKNKYKNKKAEVDGIIFDSIKESRRYGELKILKKQGLILDFECQKTYKLEVNGQLICKYISDFVVYHLDGPVVVEDVKSEMTAKLPVFRLKTKLMKAIHNIEIKII